MFKKIFTIVVPVLAITAAILLFGIKVYNYSYSTFREDGYILGIAEGKDANKYYFLKENKYKVNEAKNEVVFMNTEDEEITIPNDTFVHYTDGSLATFKKAVVLNLPNVKNSTLQYYNVYEGSVFTKASDGHQIDYLDQKLAFKDFMIKITETKYMIVGKGLTIKYGDEEKLIADGFVEIEYLDGNIIKITNQDLNIQNISKDLSITMDGITVDLLNKRIIYDGETKVNLGEITIDSDDNIEIIPEEEKKEEIKDEQLSVEHFEDQPITTPNVNIGGMQSGVVDTSTKRPDEVVEENETVPDAEFDVQGISVTVKSVNVSIKVKDEANVLVGDMSWKIVENSTNLIVCMGTVEKGTSNIGFDCGGLAPETNYSVIVRSGYVKNDVNYEKDFVQKTFVTKSMGLTIGKDYVRSEEVSFLVSVNGHSGIKGFTYDLIGPEGEIIQGEDYTLATPADTGVDQDISMIFNTNEHYKIRSNSKYTLKIYNIIYGNEELSNTYFVSKALKTLKKAPTFGNKSVAVNKQSSKFILYLNNVKDPDNGVVNYRADIYVLGQEGSKKDIVTTREASTSSTIDVDVDGKIISRDTNYRAKLYLTFYDNEMEYEIYLGHLDMIMNSVQGPAVTFESTKITHEKIEGKLTINDSNETIDLTRPIDIVSQNRSVGSSSVAKSYEVDLQTLPNKKTFTIPINDNGLKSNTSYLYTIMGWVNYNDKNGYVYAEIGTFWVNTSLPVELQGIIQDKTGDKETTTQFKINFQLGVTKADVQGENPNEVNTMESIKFRVRAEDYDPATQCIATNRCWERTFTDTNEDEYQSTLKGMFFENVYEFTPGSFNIDEADLTYGNYIFEVVKAFDYTEHQNDLPIINSSIPFNPNASAQSVIKNKIYNVEVIHNDKAIIKDYQDPNLNSGTTIGYKIVPDIAIPNTNRSEYKIVYTIVNLTTNKKHTVTDSEIVKLYTESQNDGNNAVALLFHMIPNDNGFEFRRGNAYAIEYCVTYDIGVEGKEEQKACTPTTKAFSDKDQPRKQSPYIGAYLKSRDTTAKQTWQYYVNDVDNALINEAGVGKTAYYGTPTSTVWTPVSCDAGTNCLGDTEGTFTTTLSAGSLIVKARASLLQGAMDSSYGIIGYEEEIKFVDEMIFYNVLNNIDEPAYRIELGESGNDIKIRFSGYTLSTLKKYVAHVKIKFTAADGTTAIIYKDLDNKDSLDATNAVLSVDFSEISGLMKKGKITPEISFIYDRELPGFDTADVNGEGYVIEESLNGSTSYQTFESKYKIFKEVHFDYHSGTLSYVDLKGNTGSKVLTASGKGMFYNNPSGYPAYINVKVLYNKAVTCSTVAGAVCDFSFDNIRPTFYLEDTEIETIIGGVRMKPTLVVDDSLKSGLEMTVRISKQNEDGTCSNIIDKIYKYSYATDINGKSDFTITDEELGMGQAYCVTFTYKTSSSESTEYDFFYGATYHNAGNPDRRVYNFTTLAKPTINDFKIRYDIGYVRSNATNYDTVADINKQHDNYNRSLTASFSVDTLENYDGFDFTILDENLVELEHINNIKQTLKPIEISDTSSSYTTTFQIDSSTTFATLEANTVYHFSIIAYQKCTSGVDCVGGKRMLEATNEKFVFYINKPTIKIQRIDSPDDNVGEFSIQVTVNDRYRAVGGYSLGHPENATYTIQVMNDTGFHTIDTLSVGYYYKKQTYNKIAICKGNTVCQVYVSYNADVTNTGVKLAYNEIKNITIGTSADIGQSSVISTSTSGVRIGYTDSYMITSIKLIDYTITSNASGTSTPFENVTTIWATDESNSYYYLDINLPLTRGTYTLEISYKDAKGKLVQSQSYDIIIN